MIYDLIIVGILTAWFAGLVWIVMHPHMTRADRALGEHLMRETLMREAMARMGMDPNKSLEANLYYYTPHPFTKWQAPEIEIVWTHGPAKDARKQAEQVGTLEKATKGRRAWYKLR